MAQENPPSFENWERRSFELGDSGYDTLKNIQKASDQAASEHEKSRQEETASEARLKAAEWEEELRKQGGGGMDIAEPTRPNTMPNQTQTMGLGVATTPRGDVLFTYEQPLRGKDPDTGPIDKEQEPVRPEVGLTLEEISVAAAMKEAADQAARRQAPEIAGASDTENAKSSVEENTSLTPSAKRLAEAEKIVEVSRGEEGLTNNLSGASLML